MKLTAWQQLKARFGKKKAPIIIQTAWGPVTEQARLGAAYRMKMDPTIMERVVGMIGEPEARIRYPEAFDGQST